MSGDCSPRGHRSDDRESATAPQARPRADLCYRRLPRGALTFSDKLGAAVRSPMFRFGVRGQLAACRAPWEMG